MDPIADARAVLPGWVTWFGPLMAVLVAVPGTMLVAWVGKRIAFDPPPEGAHWTERARRAAPLRAVTALLVVLAPVSFGLAASFFWVGTFSALSPLATGIVAGAASFLVALHQHRRAASHYRERPRGLRDGLAGTAVFFLVLRPFLLLLGVLVALAPPTLLSLEGALWVGGGLLLYALMVTGETLRLATWLRIAQPAGPRLQRIVAAASAAAGQTPPPTWEVVSPDANAAAFPLGDKLLFTDTALAALDDEGLEAIASHELGHLAESRSVKLVRAAAGAVWLPIAWVLAHAIELGWEVVVGSFAGVVVLNLALRRWMVEREKEADAHAHHHEATYARALATIHRVSGLPAVTATATTHPHLYDRLEAAGVAPSYPRPAPPSRARKLGSVAAVYVAALVVAIGLPLAIPLLAVEVMPEEARDEILLASSYGRDWEVASLAEARLSEEDYEGGFALYEAAIYLAESGALAYDCRARVAGLYAYRGRCDDARRHARWVSAHPEQEEDPAFKEAMTAFMVSSCDRPDGDP